MWCARSKLARDRVAIQWRTTVPPHAHTGRRYDAQQRSASTVQSCSEVRFLLALPLHSQSSAAHRRAYGLSAWGHPLSDVRLSSACAWLTRARRSGGTKTKTWCSASLLLPVKSGHIGLRAPRALRELCLSERTAVGRCGTLCCGAGWQVLPVLGRPRRRRCTGATVALSVALCPSLP
jgi:hypothetical protein